MAWTKEKQRESSRKHYEANKEVMKARAIAYTVKHKQRLREFLCELKTSTACSDCGRIEKDKPWRMDFDHCKGDPKIDNIGNAVRNSWSFDKLEKEIAKCEIVCKLCHADRTHNRRVQLLRQ